MRDTILHYTVGFAIGEDPKISAFVHDVRLACHSHILATVSPIAIAVPAASANAPSQSIACA
jgi:hypothetical protein